MTALPNRWTVARVAVAALAGLFLFTTPAAAAGPTVGTAGSATTLRADPIREGQWYLDYFNVPAAWRLSTGAGVTVAVIDSGVDASHPDLDGQVLPGTDLVDAGGNGHSDPVGHGTAVAALIAGRGDDQQGIVGLAPDAKILPVRVLDANNRYDDAMIVAKAVRYAVDNGAQVINLSLGGAGKSEALAAAIDYAFDHDVVVVACTGNRTSANPHRVWYPAREPGVVAVTGLSTNTGELWSEALTGSETVLAAPATGLMSARPGGYWSVQGTSFAAPMVAATAALIRARWPDMPAGEVVNRLISTARDLGRDGRDDTYGFGLVDPLAALTSQVPAVGRNPLDDGISPGRAGFGPSTVASTTSQPHLRAMRGDRENTSAGWTTAHSADQTSDLPWGWGLLLGASAPLGVVLVGAVRYRARSRSRR